MRSIIGTCLGLVCLVTSGAAPALAQSTTWDGDGNARAHHAPAVRQGRSVGYETWGGGYRRWSYGNFGTCNNVQLAAGMCPSYYKR